MPGSTWLRTPGGICYSSARKAKTVPNVADGVGAQNLGVGGGTRELLMRHVPAVSRAVYDDK